MWPMTHRPTAVKATSGRMTTTTMASLVADYGTDSDTGSDSDSSRHLSNDSSVSSKKPTNFFAQSDSSDEESDTDDRNTDKHVQNSPGTESQGVKLPNPLANCRLDARAQSSSFLKSPESVQAPAASSSVFMNHFQRAEHAKWSALEQHVRMTSTEPPDDVKKNICKSFKKGKCRNGRKCKFLHASDVLLKHQNESETAEYGEDQEPPATQHVYYGRQTFHQQVEEPLEDEDSYMGQAKRKFRAGIRDHLKPPKKAMVALERQRAAERPWTMGHD